MKRFLTLIALFGLAACVLTGCSKSDSTSTPTPSDATNAAAASTNK